MSQSIEIVFIDINNFDEKEEKEKEKKEEDSKKKKTILFKILDHFIENAIMIDIETKENEYYYEYSFIYQIEKGIAKQFKFHLFTKLKQDFIIDSNALFILCDLENKKTKSLLEIMIENIKNIYLKGFKTYILGIKRTNNKTALNENKITAMFVNEDIEVEYKEVNFNDNNEINNNINSKVDNNNNEINIKNNNLSNNNINNNNNNQNNINNEQKDENKDKESKDEEERIYELTDKFIEETMLMVYNNKESDGLYINRKDFERRLNENKSGCFIY